MIIKGLVDILFMNTSYVLNHMKDEIKIILSKISKLTVIYFVSKTAKKNAGEF